MDCRKNSVGSHEESESDVPVREQVHETNDFDRSSNENCAFPVSYGRFKALLLHLVIYHFYSMHAFSWPPYSDM